MKDIINVAVLNFHAFWGQKEKNLNRICGFIEAAAARGANFIIFPEMALTGYDDEPELDRKDKMQTREAEIIPGPSSERVSEYAQKCHMYAVFGMPERDPDDSAKIYNAVAICGPDGSISSYRKMHLPFPEMHWAQKGDKPCIIDTEWGPIGLSICYDSYQFPELIRYEGAKGCRMHINCTALAKCHGAAQGRTTLEAHVISEEMFVASSNLVGIDKYNDFWGGASVMGPSVSKIKDVHYYAGYPFYTDESMEEDLFIGTVDLTLANRNIFLDNPSTDGTPDWSPAKYISMFKDIMADPEFGKR